MAEALRRLRAHSPLQRPGPRNAQQSIGGQGCAVVHPARAWRWRLAAGGVWLVSERADARGFGPPAELLSLCSRKEKVTKEKARPDIRVCPLRGQTSLAPVLLRGPA